MEETLGKRIARNRKHLGMTQEQLAEKLGVTAQAVSKWENDGSCPDIAVLPQLADIFGITTDELLGREPQIPVYSGDVVDSSAEDSGSKKGTFELTWDAGKNSAVIISLFVLFSGIVYLLAQLLSCDISFWEVLWPSALIFWGAAGIAPKFSFLRLGCLLLGIYFLVTKLLSIHFELDSGILFAGVVVLFGGSLLVNALKKPRKPKFNVSYTDKFGVKHTEHTRNCLEYTEQGFEYSASFGSNQQTISMDVLKEGHISTSFGDYTVDLSGVKILAPECTLDVCCSFGELTILIPKHFGVHLANNASFADIHTNGSPDPEPIGYISMDASASFGEIEIQYI